MEGADGAEAEEEGGAEHEEEDGAEGVDGLDVADALGGDAETAGEEGCDDGEALAHEAGDGLHEEG